MRGIVKNVGPLVVGTENQGLIRFEEACLKVLIRNPKMKKKRVVLDLLKKEYIRPSYLTIPQPRSNKFFDQIRCPRKKI